VSSLSMEAPVEQLPNLRNNINALAQQVSIMDTERSDEFKASITSLQQCIQKYLVSECMQGISAAQEVPHSAPDGRGDHQPPLSASLMNELKHDLNSHNDQCTSISLPPSEPDLVATSGAFRGCKELVMAFNLKVK
jgi:hypothetical protein